MGVYINPGNSGFSEINDEDYVDKTLLIDLINKTIEKKNKLTCISRPRRFGKSYAAKMLTAYYDRSCDSHPLFDDKKIAVTDDYEIYLNRYNVICLDISGFVSTAQRTGISLREVPAMIVRSVQSELLVSDQTLPSGQPLEDQLIASAEKTDGKKYIFIIDEWDALIREAKDDEEAQKRYLNLLRGWFKNANFTPRAVAAAYMTGILPIKKDGTQSAVSDFREYTMIKPRKFGEFVGFTEDEVKNLCKKRSMDFSEMQRWYDGYSFPEVGSVYNPNSVMQALEYNDYDSFWTESSAAEGLLTYISMDYNGMGKTIAGLIGGIDVSVNTAGFANDLCTFRSRDDVLTLMIHLGYLSYDALSGTVHIPNEEIKKEFQQSIHEVRHTATLKRLDESEKLFSDTIHMNETAVAAQIEKIHAEETSPLHYNREDSLRSIVKLAYFTYRDHYLQMEEPPAGEGYADIIYIPRHDSSWPALVIELKWKQDADGAISQILKKDYPKAIANLGCPILLVGISYDRNAPAGERRHSCRIIEYSCS